MPSFQLNTNLPALAIPPNFHEELTECLHQMLKKPKKFICTWLVTDQSITWADSDEPAALCEMCCVGQISPEENKIYSATLCEKLNRDLKISPERIYITFSNMNGANIGWNGKTFAK